VERLPRLGRHAERRLVEVGLIGCAPVKTRVRSAAVVEVEITADRCAGRAIYERARTALREALRDYEPPLLANEQVALEAAVCRLVREAS
jgi:hypothetical protein